jgi:hypothetical protein
LLCGKEVQGNTGEGWEGKKAAHLLRFV